MCKSQMKMLGDGSATSTKILMHDLCIRSLTMALTTHGKDCNTRPSYGHTGDTHLYETEKTFKLEKRL